MSRRSLALLSTLSGAAALGLAASSISAGAGAAPVPGLAPSVIAPVVNTVTAPAQTAPQLTTTVNNAAGSLTHSVSSVQNTLTPASQTNQRSTTTTTYVPAPASHASATGLQVVPLIDTCLSCTSATAGPNSTSSSATAVRILGMDISAGTLSGKGGNSGNLIALPVNPLLALAIADWENSGTPGTTSSTSHARAALVDLSLANGQVATLSVLRSTSDTSWNGAVSQGTGVNDGAALDLGQGALVIILLHSEGSSTGTGSADVVSINGTEILSSSQTGGIPITIPGIATINLLDASATGGNGFGTSSGTGIVGTVADTPLAAGTNILALGATGIGSKTPPQTITPPQASTCPPTCPPAPRPPLTGNPGPTAPVTGVALGLGGFLLIGAGLATVVTGHRARGGRRRRRSRF